MIKRRKNMKMYNAIKTGLLANIALFASLHCAAQAPVVASVNPDAEALGSGNLSDANVKFLNHIVARLKVSNVPQFRRASHEFMKLAPQFKFGGGLPAYNYAYLNEDWFDKLNDSERTFVAGRLILSLDYAQKLSIQKSVVQYLLIAAGALGAYSLYKFDKLDNKWKLPVAVGSVVGGVALYKFISCYYTYCIDRIVVRRLNCLAGAVSVLGRMQDTDDQLKNYKANWKAYHYLLPSDVSLCEYKKMKDLYH